MANFLADVLNRIATMTSGTIPQSDIRIYCDHDAMEGQVQNARWVPYPDVPGYPPHLQNSIRPFQQKQYWDQTNYLFRPPGDLGVQEPGALAQTYVAMVLQPDNIPANERQNAQRSSVTVSVGRRSRPCSRWGG